MTRADFLAAVRTASGGDPAVLEHAVALANHVDRVHPGEADRGNVLWHLVVLIDGSHGAVLTAAPLYDSPLRVELEARAGEVTAVLRGADLLAGHIGDQFTDPVGRVVGRLPGGELLVLDDQCPMTDRRCDRPCGGACLRGQEPLPTEETA